MISHFYSETQLFVYAPRWTKARHNSHLFQRAPKGEVPPVGWIRWDWVHIAPRNNNGVKYPKALAERGYPQLSPPPLDQEAASSWQAAALTWPGQGQERQQPNSPRTQKNGPWGAQANRAGRQDVARHSRSHGERQILLCQFHKFSWWEGPSPWCPPSRKLRPLHLPETSCQPRLSSREKTQLPRSLAAGSATSLHWKWMAVERTAV